MSEARAVIGLGNTLRRDDGIGILVLEELKRRDALCGCESLDFGTASFDLIHRFRHYQTILLIDGINAPGLAPGALVIKPVDQLSCTSKLAGSSHELNLKDLFELSRTLGMDTRIYLAGIQVQDVSFQEGLTPQLKEQFKHIVDEIAMFIKDNLATDPPSVSGPG